MIYISRVFDVTFENGSNEMACVESAGQGWVSGPTIDACEDAFIGQDVNLLCVALAKGLPPAVIPIPLYNSLF